MASGIVAYYLSIGVMVHFALVVCYFDKYKSLSLFDFVSVTVFAVVAWPFALALYIK